MTLNLKEQVQLIEEVLEFKKRVTILKMSPSAEEFEDFRRKCKKIKVFEFDVDELSDIELLEKISEYSDGV